MAKLVDPDSLNQGTEVVIDALNKTVQLLVAGNLSDAAPGATSGVTGRCLYSFLKEEWKTDNALNKYKFPIQMIYEAQFQWINGWAPKDQQTRDLIRDAGFQETDGRENACIISLGSMDDPANDLAYYQQVAGFNQTTTNFDKTGELNENIKIKGTGGTPDNTNYLKCFLREYSKTYASYNLLTAQGLAALTYQAYRLPLSNDTDLNIVDNDTAVSSGTGSISGVTYSELSVDYLKGQLFETAAVQSYVVDDVVQDGAGRWARCTTAGTMDAAGAADYTNNGGTAVWEAYPGERQIGTNYYAFNRIIDGNDTGSTSARIKELHTWAQYQLRQTTNINANTNGDGYGTVNGNVAVDLTGFVGPTLVTNPGTYIDNFDTNDQNSIEFFDITVDGGGLDSEDVPVTSTKRTFPFVAAGSFSFSDNLVNELDSTTRYTMYFTYHTTTTDSTIAVGTPTGQSADITWTGTALDHLTTGDYFISSGFTNSGNNGLWVVNSTGANTLNATKYGAAPTAETAGASVTINENPFESPNATIVNDNSSTPIDGQVTASSINWDFDYDNNVQRGSGTNGTDAPVTVVALAYDGAQYTTVPYTITRATGQTITVSPADELNYSNPT